MDYGNHFLLVSLPLVFRVLLIQFSSSTPDALTGRVFPAIVVSRQSLNFPGFVFSENSFRICIISLNNFKGHNNFWLIVYIDI